MYFVCTLCAICVHFTPFFGCFCAHLEGMERVVILNLYNKINHLHWFEKLNLVRGIGLEPTRRNGVRT